MKTASEIGSNNIISFGDFVASHGSLTQLSNSIDAIETRLGPGDMKASFQHWRSNMNLLAFESRSSLALSDHDAILELAALHWDSTDWIRKM